MTFLDLDKHGYLPLLRMIRDHWRRRGHRVPQRPTRICC